MKTDSAISEQGSTLLYSLLVKVAEERVCVGLIVLGGFLKSNVNICNIRLFEGKFDVNNVQLIKHYNK